MTIGELRDLALRITNADLRSAEVNTGLRPILEMLDQQTRSEVVRDVIARLDEAGGYYKAVENMGYEVLADTRHYATEQQRRHIDLQICSHLTDIPEHFVLLMGYSAQRPAGWNLFSQLVRTAGNVITYHNEAVRAAHRVDDAVYQLWTDTARDLLAGLERVPGGEATVLTDSQAETITTLRRLLSTRG
jgi:hypothetical protein